MIPKQDWEWFGNAGHFICGRWCQFHLCTLIGEYLVSTVGQYLPSESAREIIADIRGVALEGRGDAREADYMRKIGFEDIGCDRKFETMVFRVDGRCTVKNCGCGLPTIIPNELDFAGYNTAGDATQGHYEMCAKVAAGLIQASESEVEPDQP